MFETAVLTAIIALIIVFVIAFLASGVRRVNQYEKGIVERWNAYEKTVEPD